MTQYYITTHDSETGKKFSEFFSNIRKTKKIQRKIGKQLGFTMFRESNQVVHGRINSVIFEQEPDMRVWRKVKGKQNEYAPNLRTKGGKAIHALFATIPNVTPKELNAVIGFKTDFFETIGYGYSLKYYGFCFGDSWGVVPPQDCTEVTASEYKERFCQEAD